MTTSLTSTSTSTVNKVCEGCSREMRGENAWCVYCGWTPEGAGPSHAPEVQTEKFRSGARLTPFVVSTAIFGPLAIIVASAGGTNPWAISFTLLLLLLGPVVFAIQLNRRLRSWVRVVPERGIQLPNESTIPWESIARVERHVGALSRLASFESVAPKLPGGFLGQQMAVGTLPLLLVYFLVFPAVSVLSPWHSRVIVHLKNGERMVYHDLENAERFERFLGYKVG